MAADKPPQTVAELWSDFDPRQDPLEVEVVRQWKEDANPMSDRFQIDQLGLCARFEPAERGVRPDAVQWNGDFPTFHLLKWQRPNETK